ncbi:DUF6907 domain-containing protein [Streptomyces sp. NPDC007264]|uniref:DUF6907 domain-containing protein n=1 Tax=Streptomyces sp. NPDC007264 TaxID=3364777 RepID=UPI0036DA69A0
MTQHLPRTVAVNVLVTKALEVDEPEWCVGHRADRANFKVDIEHNGPETFATFETRLGTLEYLRAWITHRPYATLPPEPLPLVTVEIDGDAVSLEPDQVRAFAAATRTHLDVLERLADDADRIRGGGR